MTYSYSTVINCSPKDTHTTLYINPSYKGAKVQKITSNKSYSLTLSVELKFAHLWVAPYSDYQHELFNMITHKHEQHQWNFKEISDHLNRLNYKTPRGHVFKHNHVWSIYNKKKKSIKRFAREFPSVITDVGIDVMDIAPSTNTL